MVCHSDLGSVSLSTCVGPLLVQPRAWGAFFLSRITRRNDTHDEKTEIVGLHGKLTSAGFPMFSMLALFVSIFTFPYSRILRVSVCWNVLTVVKRFFACLTTCHCDVVVFSSSTLAVLSS